MRLSASIKVSNKPKKIFRAIKPEEESSKRSSLALSLKEDNLELNIKAKDTVAMRAKFNSVMRSLLVFEKTGDLK